MCGHKKAHKHTRTVPAGPYEGETRRLDPNTEATLEHSGGHASWRHIPWWTLWLIWPLFSLLKAMFQELATAAPGPTLSIGTVVALFFIAVDDIGREPLMDWQANLISGGIELVTLLRGLRRVAVLGIRSERYSDRPAFYVPASLAAAGLEIVPVPVYEPECTEILGRPVFRSLAAIPGSIDLVDVFRRSADIPAHLEDILAKRPAVVWFQSGIRNDPIAETLAREGIKVVQDRCLMIEYRRALYA